jgi:hypothetical protein
MTTNQTTDAPNAKTGATSFEHMPNLVAPKRWTPTQPVVLVIVTVVSVAMLFAMRSIGLRSGLDFKATGVDYSHETNTEQAAKFERVMQDLARVQNPLDVKMTSIGKDPFTRHNDKRDVVIAEDAGPAPSIGMTEEENEEIRLQRQRAMEKVEILSKLGKLELHSVIGGSRPLARINKDTYQLGDLVDDMFTVVAIDGRSVVLSAKGENYTLTMDDNKNKSKKGK